MTSQWLMKKFILILILAILGFAAWTYGTLQFVYSSGERAGYIQKFSKKGWVFKTWEGELAMVSLPGTMPEKFYYTVRDEAVAEKMQGVLGQRVVVKYNEHKGIPGRVFGDTNHFATDVHVVEDPSQPQTFPVSNTPAK